jgi:hypothetical protein
MGLYQSAGRDGAFAARIRRDAPPSLVEIDPVGKKSLEPGPEDRAAEARDLRSAREYADSLGSWDPYAARRLHEMLDRCDGSLASRGRRIVGAIRGAMERMRRLLLRGWGAWAIASRPGIRNSSKGDRGTPRDGRKARRTWSASSSRNSGK